MKKQIVIASSLAAMAIVAAFAPLPTKAQGLGETNVTVIYKTNLHWPVRGLMTQDPCAIRTCQEV